MEYPPGKTLRTRAADAGLIARAKHLCLSVPQLMRVAKVSQHSAERFLRTERIHPATRMRIGKAVEQLEQERRLPSTGGGTIETS